MSMQHIRFYERNGTFRATRNFEWEGAAIAADAIFDWRKLGVPSSKVDELWSAYYIEGVRPEEKPVEQPKAVNVQRKR